MKTNTKKKKNAVCASGTDTNPRKLYEVEVHRTDYLTAYIRVWAKSKKEAEAEAEERAEYQEEKEWHVHGRDLYAFDVEQVKGGDRHV